MNTAKTVSGVVAAAALVGAGVGFMGGRVVSAEATRAETSAGATAAARMEQALREAREENARLAGEAASLRAKIAEQTKTLEEQGGRLAKFEEASKGADKKRLFKDVDELGKFTAEVSLRALALVKRYKDPQTQPKPNTPEYATMMAEIGKVTEDHSLLLQDPMFLEEMQSGDPNRMAALQLAYLGEMMNLDGAQRAVFKSAVEQGYREAYAQKLEWKPKDPELARINREAVAKVKATLTPRQTEVFNELKIERLLFNFTVGQE